MTEFTVTIPGEVVGKQYQIIMFGRGPNARPSLTSTKKAKSALERYREAVKIRAMQVRWESLDCPLYVHIRAFIDIRRSWSAIKKQKALSGEMACTAKPDPDNIAKMVLDALVGPKVKHGGFQTYEQVVMTDDKLVSDLLVQKRWCEIGQERLEITVTPMLENATFI